MITINNYIKGYQERLKQLDKSISDNNVSDEDAALIIEIVLDSLVEVGNGTSKQTLHESANYLFALRDKWFKNKIFK
jgi:hypothetical protein